MENRDIGGERKFMRLLSTEGATALIAALFTIILGLLISFMILLFFEGDVAVDAFRVLITGSFGTIGLQKGLARVLYYTAPLILTGLSVSFTMKSGVFNIGVAGQFVVGLCTSVFVAIRYADFFGEFTWLAAVLSGAFSGCLWGGLQGVLQAFFNIHPIVIGIMMNYIGLFTVSMLCEADPMVYAKGRGWTEVVPLQAIIPDGGLDRIFGRTSAVNVGLYAAVVLCVVAQFILKKTAFGYEMKAVGYNPNASQYAGISVQKSIILSMLIAGMFAGFGGAIQHLSAADTHYAITDALPQQGFAGISIALIASGNPLAVIFAAFFVAFLQVGGLGMQAYGIQPDFVDVITSLIIYFCAFSFVFKYLYGRLLKKLRRIK
ncbi:MAG: ABC transporter permease [Clostridiales Family XIII bacterium]|jgi:simple sugar transport system permease protein|nr:ABC transporter permease [Clostridiales Family XIII bacterium]